MAEQNNIKKTAVKRTTTPITEDTALELIKQMKRVADAMDRNHKYMMMTGGKEKLQEIANKQS